MSEFVDELNIFNQISTDAPHQLMKVVLVERVLIVEPKGDVFVARRIFWVGLELSDLIRFKLRQKARIFAPKQPNVVNAEQFHGPAFQTQTKGPATLRLRISTRIFENAIKDDTAAKYF